MLNYVAVSFKTKECRTCSRLNENIHTYPNSNWFVSIMIRHEINHMIYTVSQKNPCDYDFDDNLNSKRPIVIIFGTVIT